MYLLDTDTLIYFLKGENNVVKNFRDHESQPKAISVISYGEMIYGAEKSERVSQNMAKVHQLAELYPIIEIGRSVMDSFGEIKASLSCGGITVDDFDLLIGCTALTLNYTVVTNNIKHYQRIPGLSVVNWAV